MNIDERIERYKKYWRGDGYSAESAALINRHRDHCAEHFPAMLNALRGALMDVVVINGNQTRQGLHPYAVLQKMLEQTIAAAENVENQPPTQGAANQ